MFKVSHKLYAMLMMTLISFSQAVGANSLQFLEEFETQLDMTIRSACHGFMVDAIPDFFGETREWLNENTPFCQTVRTLPEGASAVDAFKEALSKASPQTRTSFESDFRRLYDPNDPIFAECQDWMCQHIRTEQQHRKTPVSLADYQRVEDYCEGSYGCIEDWFASWPRALPQASAPALSLDSLMTEPAATQSKPSTGLSLDSLMSGPSEDTSVAAATATLPSAATSLEPDSALSPELSLDNIHAARESLKLEALGKSIARRQARLRSLCDCSLSASGCYQLPSKDLLQAAGSLEDQRVGLCRTAGLDQSPQPASLEEGQRYEQLLAATDRQVRSLDDSMQSQISQWQRRQERLLAEQRQRQQDQSDAAFLAGMATIVGGAGLVNDGMMSAEQLANVAAQVARDVESGQSVTSSISSAVGQVNSNISSNLSSGSASNSGSYGGAGNQSQGNDGVYNISCYNAAQMICIDYTVYKRSQFEQFQKQCGIAPNKIINGGCSREGTSCTISKPKGKQVMFTYHVAAETVQRQCAAFGGTFTQY